MEDRVSWAWIIAALLVTAFAAFTFGVLLMGALCSSSRAVELDHLFLSRSTR